MKGRAIGMEYRIKYTGICMKGFVRQRNEDNLWCAGYCLPMQHPDEEYLFDGFADESDPRFAVFDGMGGAKCGDAAAYEAAMEFGRHPAEENERILCREMNRKVLDYADAHLAFGMGTTVAALRLEEHGASGFNVGDSRCYAWSGGRFTQLSNDHTSRSVFTGRTLLTQCIGIPESEFIPEPSCYSISYRPNDLYLICSDGLWGVVNDRTIAGIIAAEGALSDKRDRLKREVLRSGAPDNMTLLLLEVLQNE